MPNGIWMSDGARAVIYDGDTFTPSVPTNPPDPTEGYCHGASFGDYRMEVHGYAGNGRCYCGLEEWRGAPEWLEASWNQLGGPIAPPDRTGEWPV